MLSWCKLKVDEGQERETENAEVFSTLPSVSVFGLFRSCSFSPLFSITYAPMISQKPLNHPGAILPNLLILKGLS